MRHFFDRTLIVTDLDGTLLNRQQCISKENEAAIKWFVEKGGKFTFATGRIEEAVFPFVHQLNIQLPLILYNGARIYCPRTEQILYEQNLSIESSLLNKLIAFHGEQACVLLYDGAKVYTPNRNIYVRRYEKKEGIKTILLKERDSYKPLIKILIIASSIELARGIENNLSDENGEFSIVSSEPKYIEILPQDVCKGRAVARLKQLLKIENHQVISIGDNLNDITMIQSADYGYAVENAHPYLKNIADEVIVNNEEHALSVLIKKLFLVEI